LIDTTPTSFRITGEGEANSPPPGDHPAKEHQGAIIKGRKSIEEWQKLIHIADCSDYGCGGIPAADGLAGCGTYHYYVLGRCSKICGV